MNEQRTFDMSKLAAAITAAKTIAAAIPATANATLSAAGAARTESAADSAAYHTYHAAATAAWRMAARFALSVKLNEQGGPFVDDQLYISPTENTSAIERMMLEQVMAAAQDPDSFGWKLRRGWELRMSEGAEAAHG